MRDSSMFSKPQACRMLRVQKGYQEVKSMSSNRVMGQTSALRWKMVSRQSKEIEVEHSGLVSAEDDVRDDVYRILPEETKVEANRELLTRT